MLTLRLVGPSLRTAACLNKNVLRAAVTAKSTLTSRDDGIQSRVPSTTLGTQLAFFPKQARWYAAKAASDPDDVTGLERVYYGSLAPRMKVVKVFSLTTSAVGLAVQPVLMEQGMKMGGTGLAVFLCSVAGFFTFVTPLMLHFVTKKYVTEIHYNPATKEYTATTISLLLRRIRTKFRPDEVKVPEVPGMFTSFIVGKRSLFVDPTLFEDTEHYARIMGYDKPVDFKLDLKTVRTGASSSHKKDAN